MPPVVMLPRNVLPPPVCFGCGTNQQLTLVPCDLETSPKEHAAYEAAAVAGALLGPVGMVIEGAASLHQHASIPRATVPLPLCPACASRPQKWKNTKTNVSIAPVLVAGLVCFTAIWLLARAGLLQGWRLYAVAVAATPPILFARDHLPKRILARMTPFCEAVAIHETHVALVHVHPAAAAAVAQMR